LLEYSGVRRTGLPKSQAVQLATLVDAAPAGDDWLHEIKFDGYRMICRIEKGKARFISRNGYYARVADWMLPHIIDRPLSLVRCPAGSGKPGRD
jgi:hypothetical protein